MQEILKQELNKELKKFESSFDGRIELAIQELKTQSEQLIINGIEDTEGYNKVKELHILVKNKCSEIEKTKKALNEDALAWQRSVNSEYKRIMGLLEPIKDDLDNKRKEIDQQKELEKTRIEREEAERQQKRIDRLYELGYTYDGMSYNLGDSMLHPVTIASYSDETFEVLIQKGVEIKAELMKKKQAEEEELAKKAQEEEKQKQERVAFLKERYEMRLFKLKEIEIYAENEQMYCKKYSTNLVLCSQREFVHVSSEEFEDLIKVINEKIENYAAVIEKQAESFLKQKEEFEQAAIKQEQTMLADKDKFNVFKEELRTRVTTCTSFYTFTTKTYTNKQEKLIQDILNLL